MDKINDFYNEYLRLRALIEEHNANIFVEDFVEEPESNSKILMIRFFVLESNPERIVTQVIQISKEYRIDSILFAVGKSNYLCYLATENKFYRVLYFKSNFLFTLTVDITNFEIPKNRILQKIHCLFLEHKRRVLNENNKNS